MSRMKELAFEQEKDNPENLPQLFNYENNQVRTIIKNDGSVWFVGLDVCKVLDLKNTRDALSKLKSTQRDEVGLSDAIGRTQQTTIISEPGVYKLVLKSRKKEAEKFQDWICEKVIPEIRKKGSYSVVPEKPKSTLELLEAAVSEIKSKNAEIAYLKPVASLAEAILTQQQQSKRLSHYGKFLKQFIPEVGRNKIYEYCMQKGYLFKNKSGKFEVRSEFIQDGNKKFFYIESYVLPVSGKDKTFNLDCWQIRITALGSKVLLSHLIKDNKLSIKEYNKVLYNTEKFFQMPDEKDVC